MGQKEVKQFNEMVDNVQKIGNELNNALMLLRISSLSQMVALAALPEPPKKYYQTYKSDNYRNNTDRVYMKEINAVKRVVELQKNNYPEAHYDEIAFDD